jgi:hypothetical protein
MNYRKVRTVSAILVLVGLTAVGLWPATAQGPDGSAIASSRTALHAAGAPVAPTLSPIERGWFGDYVVDWSDVAGATRYTLQEDDNMAFASPTVLYDGADSEFTVTDQPGGTWYYRVRASNSEGPSPWSNIEWVSVLPSKPVLYAIDNSGFEDEYVISWSPSVGADGYKLVEFDNALFRNPKTRYIGPALQYHVTGQPGGTWYYVVWGYNRAGDGAWSNRQSTTVGPAVLASPELFPIGDASDGSYLVRWTEVNGATSYTLEESLSPYFEDPQQVYSGAAAQFEVVSQSGGVWHYRVRASGVDGKSPWSSQQTATVKDRLYLPLTMRNHKSDGPGVGIVNGDFESGPTAWTQHSTHGANLIMSSGFPTGIAPHSGTWAVWLGGLYNEVSRIQQQVIVPRGRPYLTYWQRIDSTDDCGYDTAGVSIDGVMVDGYDLCWTESTNDWELHVVHLGAYRGKSVSLQIWAETDGVRNSNLFVDDVSFHATAP